MVLDPGEVFSGDWLAANVFFILPTDWFLTGVYV